MLLALVKQHGVIDVVKGGERMTSAVKEIMIF